MVPLGKDVCEMSQLAFLAGHRKPEHFGSSIDKSEFLVSVHVSSHRFQGLWVKRQMKCLVYVLVCRSKIPSQLCFLLSLACVHLPHL